MLNEYLNLVTKGIGSLLNQYQRLDRGWKAVLIGVLVVSIVIAV
jgi:hypothetical protein